MTPTFSVVVPAYNAARTVAATIRSIQLQSFDSVELIVVDDGSTDATADVVREAADERTILVQQRNTGLAGARNAGIARATGRYVAFLDADDLWLPRYLDAVLAGFDREPAAALAYSDGWSLDQASGRVKRESFLAYQRPPATTVRDPDWLVRRLLVNNFLISTAVVTRAVLCDLGSFRVDVPGVEDYELWLRIVANGHYFVRLPGRIVVKREMPDSMSKDHAHMLDSALRVLDVVLAEYRLTDEQQALARRKRESIRRRRDALRSAGFSPRRSSLALARAAKRRALERWRWLPRQPEEVSRLLRAVGDPLAEVS